MTLPSSAPRISVTSLDTYADCPMKWYLGARLGIKPKPDELGITPWLSGNAVHWGLEAGLSSEGKDRKTNALDAATTYLYAHGSGGGRYEAGVHRAIMGLPEDWWYPQHEHVLEEKFEQVYEWDGYEATFVGKLDLWTFNGERVIIVDFKSTSKDEWKKLAQYQLFNMQPRYYAVLLTDWLREQGKAVPPIYINHFVLSTRAKHAIGTPWLVDEESIALARQRMLAAATPIVRNWDVDMNLWQHGNLGWRCPSCDYGPLHEVELTGGDVQSIIDEQYSTREQRDREHLAN